MGKILTPHVIDVGSAQAIDQHDDTQLMVIDGDLDIASIGWHNPKVSLYENLASCRAPTRRDCEGILRRLG